MYQILLLILVCSVTADHDLYGDVRRSAVIVEHGGANYTTNPARIYHTVEFDANGNEMGFGNYEHPENAEFRVHGDAYVAESLYVGANITVTIWNETCCAPLYDTTGNPWANGSGVQYTEETCPSCVNATCLGCRREILLAEYIEQTVRQMNLLYQVLFSASYETVSGTDNNLEIAGELKLMPLKITRDADFTGEVDVGQYESV